MQQEKRATSRWSIKRTAVLVAAAVAALATTGTALAASEDPVEPAAPAPVVAADQAKKPGFFETYRGHHIMGWGSGAAACAYIDGKRLVIYPGDGGTYTSAIQSFKPEKSVKLITKASVKSLGDLGLSAATEPSTTCPDFETVAPPVATPPAATPPKK